MTNAAGAPKRTAGRTALRLAVRPRLACARCGVLLLSVRPNQRFCGDNCRKRDSEQKWADAPAAVYRLLVAWLMAGRVDGIPDGKQVADALDWATAKRRARLMVALGLSWNSEVRQWQTKRQ